MATKMRLSERVLVFISITKQRIKESIVVIEIILSILTLFGFANLLLGRVHNGFKLLALVHRGTRLQPLRMFIEPFLKKRIKVTHEPLPVDREEIERLERELGDRIMVLKKPGPSSERGVLFVMFNDVIAGLPALFNMEKLLHDYYLVLEPSYTGYCHQGILQYTKYQEAIFVACPEDEDYKFLVRIRTNLKPVTFGARDWIDPRWFDKCKDPSETKTFDIVMNSQWGWVKRHHVLFEKLKSLRSLKVALIGVPWSGRTLENVKALAKYYEVEDQVTFFERIPYEEVMRITCRSKLGILLSLKEGSNRAIPECLFCDIPAIVLSRNIGGVKKVINPQTGLHVTEDKLASAIKFMLANLNSYAPRKWALDNISCIVTTSKLNSCLREHALSNGEPWSRDIVPRTNSPESKYYHLEDEEEYKMVNQDLSKYFRQ